MADGVANAAGIYFTLLSVRVHADDTADTELAVKLWYRKAGRRSSPHSMSAGARWPTSAAQNSQQWLIREGIVTPSDAPAGAATHAACSIEEHSSRHASAEPI